MFRVFYSPCAWQGNSMDAPAASSFPFLQTKYSVHHIDRYENTYFVKISIICSGTAAAELLLCAGGTPAALCRVCLRGGHPAGML